jgi:hypothetical protein
MTTTERAVLAGGCFWGMQDLIRRRPGAFSRDFQTATLDAVHGADRHAAVGTSKLRFVAHG